ncbi:hypothetical protein P1J78_15010 [Psychromarinibacter sp. C21-152]|uniref:SNARE associated Golgi protein n=1 Tax=Psychromarinibacter sediminicola TaxID=3033385 RepID=A0AAE3TAX5_9RHOB|nr:hypothetical protein [Psychromarinibacter sediminicola]MDF0602050.1 hypothetical protein [Psychromarinibacter sediminicola]
MAAPEIRPMSDPAMRGFVTGAVALYVLTAAIPFVPGAEIGLALLLMFGGAAAPVVYAGMVGALLLSYGAGRLVPPDRLCRALRWMRLRRAAELVCELAGMPQEERAARLAGRLPPVFGRLVRNRHVLLALLINMPGNTLLGGGGGLAFAAGLSGVYGFPGYALTVVVAVAPVPLIFWWL